MSQNMMNIFIFIANGENSIFPPDLTWYTL